MEEVLCLLLQQRCCFGLTELTFEVLSGRRTDDHHNHAPVYADADFAIVGSINPNQTKPEGPSEITSVITVEHEFRHAG